MEATGHYAPVNGLNLYYEVQGAGQPLVLLHGAFSAIGTSFGTLLPALAETRQVIAVELQAHGRTADIDRPLSAPAMADDVAGLLRHLGLARADLFGYSMGGGIALMAAIQHPELVRKLIVASVTYNPDGLHPGHDEGMAGLKPEHLFGSPWHDEYARLAPDPDHFPVLFAKIMEMSRNYPSLPPETVRAITAPTLIVIGDSDIVRPEHAVELFRLLGGGHRGDMAGMPSSQLAVLPGTSHTGVVDRAALLLPMITAFLDAPMPAQT